MVTIFSSAKFTVLLNRLCDHGVWIFIFTVLFLWGTKLIFICKQLLLIILLQNDGNRQHESIAN